MGGMSVIAGPSEKEGVLYFTDMESGKKLSLILTPVSCKLGFVEEESVKSLKSLRLLVSNDIERWHQPKAKNSR